MKIWIVKAYEKIYYEGDSPDIIVKAFTTEGKAEAWEKQMNREVSISFVDSPEEIEVE